MYHQQHIENDANRPIAVGHAIAAHAPVTGAGCNERDALRVQVQDYIAAHLHRVISPGEIVQAFACSRPTLYRVFESDGGLVTYIRNCRLREAAVMLVDLPFRSIVDVAYCVGFSSGSDFSRAFRRHFGTSPSAYRRTCVQSRFGDAEAGADTDNVTTPATLVSLAAVLPCAGSMESCR